MQCTNLLNFGNLLNYEKYYPKLNPKKIKYSHSFILTNLSYQQNTYITTSSNFHQPHIDIFKLSRILFSLTIGLWRSGGLLRPLTNWSGVRSLAFGNREQFLASPLPLSGAPGMRELVAAMGGGYIWLNQKRIVFSLLYFFLLSAHPNPFSQSLKSSISTTTKNKKWKIEKKWRKLPSSVHHHFKSYVHCFHTPAYHGLF